MIPSRLALASLCLLAACSEADPRTLADGRAADTRYDAGLFTDVPSTSTPDAEDDTAAPVDAPFVINEVAAAGEPSDWFELCNRTDADIDLTDYTFTDDVLAQPERGLFESGTTLPAGGYLQIFVSSDLNGFGLGGDEELGVYAPDGTLIDAVDWDEGASPAGGSYARSPDCEGGFVSVDAATPGASNG